jgi:hypothetical protein
MEEKKWWYNKDNKDFTLEDALNAMEEGFCCVCYDGKVKYVNIWGQ